MRATILSDYSINAQKSNTKLTEESAVTMATSFVKFGSNGFWAQDSDLEIWLHLLVREIHICENPPLWLSQLREHWQIQSTVGLQGCISVKLDEYITDDNCKDVGRGSSAVVLIN